MGSQKSSEAEKVQHLTLITQLFRLIKRQQSDGSSLKEYTKNRSKLETEKNEYRSGQEVIYNQGGMTSGFYKQTAVHFKSADAKYMVFCKTGNPHIWGNVQ